MAKKTVEENTVETTTENTGKTAVETAAKPATIYIGQPLPGLPTYKVFTRGELPDYVKQMIAENENIGGLIVPVGELQTARQNISKKGHPLNVFAEKLKVKKEK
ncbi:MAG: hypothetical protein IKA32_11940 [Lentisphaeria bacterium]|nr:hypothetical protein [Lentisphaeria bacterium]